MGNDAEDVKRFKRSMSLLAAVVFALLAVIGWMGVHELQNMDCIAACRSQGHDTGHEQWFGDECICIDRKMDVGR